MTCRHHRPGAVTADLLHLIRDSEDQGARPHGAAPLFGDTPAKVHSKLFDKRYDRYNVSIAADDLTGLCPVSSFSDA